MKLSELKALSRNTCRDLLGMGNLTKFEVMFRDYLNDEIRWPTFKAEDIVRLRNQLNLTQEALAALLKVSAKTVQRWENDGEEIPNTVNIALCVVSKLGDGVFELMNENVSRFQLSSSPTENSDNLTKDVEDPKFNLELNRNLSQAPDPFKGKAVTELRRRLGVSRAGFAKLLGVSLSTIAKWEADEVTPGAVAVALMKILWKQGRSALDS